MAFQTIWYFSNLPNNVVEILDNDLKQFDEQRNTSLVYNNTENQDIRKSKNVWVPTTHWIGGFMWHYIMMSNRQNFLYDLSNIDGEHMQYTFYGPGEHYNWHIDDGLSTSYKPQSFGNRNDDIVKEDFINKSVESIRKLSVILQLSDPLDYEGGNVEIIDDSGNPYVVPRIKGTVVVFDSRSKHKVYPVTKGLRRSLVAWVVGPRWK